VNIADNSQAVWFNTCEHVTFDYVYLRVRACVRVYFAVQSIEIMQSNAAACSVKNRPDSFAIVR
jgi:hypothetical protein